jgi:hypothetical protein
MAKACWNICKTLQQIGEIDEAIKYSLRNIEMSQKSNDIVGLSLTLTLTLTITLTQT